MRSLLALLLCTTLSATLYGQWDLQDSHTTASLRGIHNVGGGVAWASGTNGTVLRTEDGGYLWQTCAVPPGAEKLDFRGIQAFDENTAIVMSSGKGDLSRLYKTTDGCKTWKLVFTNPDKDGFWDALQFTPPTPSHSELDRYRKGHIVGDPINGEFPEFISDATGEHWEKASYGTSNAAKSGEALFAASNTSLLLTPENGEIFVTGGIAGSRSRLLSEYVKHDPRVSWRFTGGEIPLIAGETGGAFSVAASYSPGNPVSITTRDQWTVYFFPVNATLVAVGGDYKKPNEPRGTAALSTDGGLHWTVAINPPHGYRSAVAYDEKTKTWITVGPNGTDISTDDGKNWRALKPKPGQPADADKNWNALSLPFVVGPNGRIGKLRDDAFNP